MTSRAFVAVSSALLLGACGSTGGSPPAGFDAAYAESAVPLSEDAAVAKYGDLPVCNSVANAAPTVDYQLSSSEPPTQTGGSIEDGTYVTTAAMVYGAGAADGGLLLSTSLTLEVSGSSWQFSATNGGEPSSSVSAIFSPNGASFTLTESCPVKMPLLSGTFSASNQEITLRSETTGAKATIVTTYTRRN